MFLLSCACEWENINFLTNFSHSQQFLEKIFTTLFVNMGWGDAVQHRFQFAYPLLQISMAPHYNKEGK